MPFVAAVACVIAAFVFHVGGRGQIFPGVCRLSRDLCFNPQYFLYAALFLVLLGLTMRIGGR